MAFCGKCGANLAEGATFCGKCGSSVGQPDAGIPFPPPMQYVPPSAGPMPNLTARVTNILMQPKLEWPVIERETTSVASLYSGYIAILAAIPAVAGFIGMGLIGVNYGFGTIKISVATALAGAIVQYVLMLAGVYVSALVIDKLAPNFQSQPNFLQALKLVAYASTASWLVGIFSLLPVLSFFGLLGLYSVYLFYLGLPVMMKTPKEKVIPYMVVSAIIIIVIYVVIGFVVNLVVRPSFSLGGITG